MLDSNNLYKDSSSMFHNKIIDKAKVSIVKANDYYYPKIYEAVDKSLQLIGGLDRIVKRGDRIFIKINHLSPPSPPERGIVTHPVFLQAVLGLLKKYVANITVGDDIDSGARDGFEVSGIRQMCQRAGVRLVNLREAGFVEMECNGLLLERVYISRIALETDVIINLPKFKSHQQLVATFAVKNMFGCISGKRKALWHFIKGSRRQ